MPIDDLPKHSNIYPAEVARLVVRAAKEGWLPQPTKIFENPK
jgi:hypothetical protein